MLSTLTSKAINNAKYMRIQMEPTTWQKHCKDTARRGIIPSSQVSDRIFLLYLVLLNVSYCVSHCTMARTNALYSVLYERAENR